jgi:hypothetical protein
LKYLLISALGDHRDGTEVIPQTHELHRIRRTHNNKYSMVRSISRLPRGSARAALQLP